MKKNDIILKIELYEDDIYYDITVTGWWRINPDEIVEVFIVEEFPELELLHLIDGDQPGVIDYIGDLTADELLDELKNMGFLVEIDNLNTEE